MIKSFLEKPTILIVDDIVENLKAVGRNLGNEGYNVAIASSGEKALHFAETKLPDLILLDIQMPEMDGYEVCMKLKENFKTKNIPVIFFTAHNSHQDIVKGFQAGAVDFISKPFDVRELLARVKVHLELKITKDRLEQYASELSEANIKLMVSEEQLEEINNAKDRFLSIIGHDLRGPIGNLKQIISIMEYDDFEDEDEKKMFYREVKKSINSIYGLMEGLLEWAKSQKGELLVKPVKINLYTSVKNTVEVLSAQIFSKSVDVKIEVPEYIDITADKYMIETVIRNLLSNSIKYSNENGLIRVLAYTECDKIFISIVDNGTGIRDEIKNKLFAITEKTSMAGTSGEKGSGLGLILCKEFVERHKGEIWVESEYGKGSVFTVMLPVGGVEVEDESDMIV